jgi:hypothetical protein
MIDTDPTPNFPTINGFLGMMAKLWPLAAVVFLGLANADAVEPASQPVDSVASKEADQGTGSSSEKPSASSQSSSSRNSPGYGRGYGSGGEKRHDAEPTPAGSSEKPAGTPIEEPLPPPTDEISRWIKQLDSDEYWTREDASKRLFRAGRAAVAALSEAARSPKLEVSTRAVAVLAQLIELDDPRIELAAESVLEEIAASRVTSAAARAETALEGYRGSRQERALARLRELGASVVATSFSNGDVAAVQITIGEGWRGNTDDLVALKRIPKLQRLSIYEGSVDDGALQHLLSLKQLTGLELFGTGISDDGLKELTKELANTKIDRRKGGLLGVGGDPTVRGGGCFVTTVQPGTAADKAGLQPGDVITKFEGKEVSDFTALTELISAKGGGETVELEFERQTQVGEKIEKQSFTRKATLDRWKTRMALNVIQSGDLEIIIGR